MTFREKLMQEYPDLCGEEFAGGCNLCPKTYGYEKDRPKTCGTRGCASCWDRKMPTLNEAEGRE